MRNLNIDIAGPASHYRMGDAVVIWAPTVRKSERPGGLVSTTPYRIPLTGGKASIPVESGPLKVQLQVGGFVDTKPRTIAIPAGTGTISLASLLGMG